LPSQNQNKTDSGIPNESQSRAVGIKGATQVFQVPGEDAEGDLENKLARLDTKLTLIDQVLQDLKNNGAAN